MRTKNFHNDSIRSVMAFALIVALMLCSWAEANKAGEHRVQTYDRNISQLLEKSYWVNLAPELHVNEAAFIKSFHPFAFNENPVSNSYKELLLKEGYVQKSPMKFQVNLKQMKAVMDHLAQRNIPVVFAFVYDEFWIMFYRLHRHLQGAISPDYIRLPVFWAWRIDPQQGHKGFSPHRDEYDSTRALFADGSPQKLGVWIPLSDATPMNGCMYILPADRDPTYNETNKSKDLAQHHWFGFIQDFRALPAKAQSVLMWNFRVYHYGGHASERASEPRYSISMEFQHEDSSLPKISASGPLKFPSFWERLWLISHQLLLFEHRTEIVDREVMMLGEYIRRMNILLGDQLKEQSVLDSGGGVAAAEIMGDGELMALLPLSDEMRSSSKSGGVTTMSAPPSQLQARANKPAQSPSLSTTITSGSSSSRSSSKIGVVSLPPSKSSVDMAQSSNAWAATLPPVKKDTEISGSVPNAWVASLPPVNEKAASKQSVPLSPSVGSTKKHHITKDNALGLVKPRPQNKKY